MRELTVGTIIEYVDDDELVTDTYLVYLGPLSGPDSYLQLYELIHGVYLCRRQEAPHFGSYLKKRWLVQRPLTVNELPVWAQQQYYEAMLTI